MAENENVAPGGEFILYTTEDGKSQVECRFENETLWLSQALMGELFGRSTKTINEHLKNIYAEEELSAKATIRKFRIVRIEGSREVVGYEKRIPETEKLAEEAIK